ncbi:MAG: methyltransferase [Desulfobacteraceae bacterium]|nr:methyltransferase [Desulfobacteraceae bacterium]
MLTIGAGGLAGAGLLLIRRAMRDLEALGQGTPNPARPPRRLVTAGSYRWCRHPMFLGYDLAALGVVVLCRSLGALAISGGRIPSSSAGTWPPAWGWGWAAG